MSSLSAVLQLDRRGESKEGCHLDACFQFQWLDMISTALMLGCMFYQHVGSGKDYG